MAIIADGPEAVGLMRLIALKHAVRLEKIGLKSRGGSKRKMAALEMGLKATAKHDDVVAALEAEIVRIHATGVGFTNTERE